MKHSLSLVAALAALGLAAYFAFGGRAHVNPHASAENTAHVETHDDDAIALEGPTSAAADDFERTDAERASQDPTSARALLFGRCVDEDGTPLAACTAQLRGFRASKERMDAYLTQHDKPDWENPETIVSGADGRFSFDFVPPPPYQFILVLRCRDRVVVQGRWSKILPGTHNDLGDVVVRRGTRLRGRIVDTLGKAIGEAALRLTLDSTRVSIGIHNRSSATIRTLQDGSFESKTPLTAGRWKLRVDDRELISPKSIQIPAKAGLRDLAVLVQAESELKTITGTVVDEHGEPVEHVRLMAFGQGLIVATSAANGDFVLKSRLGVAMGPLRIRASRPGYEYAQPAERYDWGARGVRIVMRRGLDVEVRVTDAHTNTPIEEYGVRIGLKSRTSWNSQDDRLRASGRHDRGIAKLSGVRRGLQLLLVEPKSKNWASHIHEFIASDDGTPRQHIKLSRRVERRVRIVRPDGEGIPGSKVEILQALPGGRVDTDTIATEQGFGTTAANRALRRSRGVTDQAGECTVHGPAGRKLSLRALGPGHIPLVVQDVVLDQSSEPMIVRVAIGASVVGRIKPVSFVEQLLAEADLERVPSTSKRFHQLAPGIRLRRTVGERRHTFPKSGRCLVGTDGRFEVSGIPPGTWDVDLTFHRSTRSGSYSGKSIEVVQLRNLRDDECRNIELDLSKHRRGTLRGRIFVDGKVYSNQAVYFYGTSSARAGTGSNALLAQAQTDDDGNFERAVAPGTYRARVYIRDAATGAQSQIPGDQKITIAPGRDAEAIIRLQSGTVELELRDSKGELAPDAVVFAKGPLLEYELALPKPNKEGLLRARLAAGTWQIRVRHRDLVDVTAYRAFLAKHPGNPNASKLTKHDVRHIQVLASEEPVRMRLTLPNAAGY